MSQEAQRFSRPRLALAAALAATTIAAGVMVGVLVTPADGGAAPGEEPPAVAQEGRLLPIAGGAPQEGTRPRGSRRR
jgi:hypothetical protein